VIPAFSFSGRLIGVSLADIARALGGVGAASLVMGGVVALVEWRLVDGWEPISQLAVGIVTGLAVYGLVVHGASPTPYRDLRQLLADLRGRGANSTIVL
jgi:hypothetical protein